MVCVQSQACKGRRERRVSGLAAPGPSCREGVFSQLPSYRKVCVFRALMRFRDQFEGLGTPLHFWTWM